MSQEFDVAIIGGGLAGLSAALTAGRLGHSVVLLTDGVPGGELLKIEKIDGVPGYAEGVPGYDLCPITQEQAEELGVEFVDEPATGISAEGEGWKIASGAGDIVARGLIMATGTAMARLGLPGEERLHGKGVSECASCDAPLLRGKVAVVAGGGDSAMQEALVLADHLEKVIMVMRGDGLAGQARYREAVEENPKIELRCNTVPTEIVGEDAVTAVKVKDEASGVEDEIAADAIFTFIGLVPNTGLVADLVALDDTGRIRVDAAMRSDAKGLCAVGNVREGSPHRAVGAMGDAAAAAVALDRYLATGAWRDA
ncbi:FAD-dependent oxidoreductase [Oricola sp.]|uniref:NAD(P)/FAD-dependent oxidoreductase n=1 Tax=Oricola sp. TaxID=1979950 RepID=UPI0025D0C974|nr:FAD-dependent oxidoreductase [Oricola sp.]MCI5078602.1 NAD(P)/FAD-dependent oxidoreductase [Oricola sp.]